MDKNSNSVCQGIVSVDVWERRRSGMANRIEELTRQLKEANELIHVLSEDNNQLSSKYHQVKEEIFDLQGSVMMVAAEAKHESEKELAANRSELNLKEAEIKDLQRDLRKMKRLQEEAIKECNELKSSMMSSSIPEKNPETIQNSRIPSQPLSIFELAMSPDNLTSSFLTEISISFHLSNSEIADQMAQTLQLLESEIFSTSFNTSSEPKVKRHKYLSNPPKESSPGTAELQNNAPLDSNNVFKISNGIAKSCQSSFSTVKLKWLEASSRFQKILISFFYENCLTLATEISFFLVDICKFMDSLLDLVPMLSNCPAEINRILGLIVKLISGCCHCLSTGYQSIDQLSIKYDILTSTDKDKNQRPLKRKIDSIQTNNEIPPIKSRTNTRCDDIISSSHELLSGPMLHSLFEVLSLAHSNPTHFKKEYKQSLMTSLASVLLILCKASNGLDQIIFNSQNSLSEMKLKLLYSVLQCDDTLVNLRQKISLLTYFGNTLERDEKVFHHFATEELRWQQTDSIHDASSTSSTSSSPSSSSSSSSSMTSTNDQLARKKIVSFNKYLCRIFDSTISPPLDADFDNPTQILSLIEDTVNLLEYKYRILCFMNQLMQRYGKRALECFLGASSLISLAANRKNSISIGYKQILPSICRMCVQTIQSLENISQNCPQKFELEISLVHGVSQFLLNLERSLQGESSLKKLIESSKSSELLDTILWRVYHNRLPAGLNPSDWSILVDLFDD